MIPKLFNYEIDVAFENDLSQHSSEYENRFVERYKVLESNITLIHKVKTIAVDESNQDMTILWNAFGYINLLSYDLISVGYSVITEKGEWQKVYFARQVALLLYEGSMDLPELLGKYFKAIFSKSTNANQWLELLKKYLSDLNAFKTTNQSFLHSIRMNTSGHRDHNINNQLDIITSINPYAIKDLMFEFDNILHGVMNHIQPVIVGSLTPKK